MVMKGKQTLLIKVPPWELVTEHVCASDVMFSDIILFPPLLSFVLLSQKIVKYKMCSPRLRARVCKAFVCVCVKERLGERDAEC